MQGLSQPELSDVVRLLENKKWADTTLINEVWQQVQSSSFVAGNLTRAVGIADKIALTDVDSAYDFVYSAVEQLRRAGSENSADVLIKTAEEVAGIYPCFAEIYVRNFGEHINAKGFLDTQYFVPAVLRNARLAVDAYQASEDYNPEESKWYIRENVERPMENKASDIIYTFQRLRGIYGFGTAMEVFSFIPEGRSEPNGFWAYSSKEATDFALDVLKALKGTDTTYYIFHELEKAMCLELPKRDSEAYRALVALRAFEAKVVERLHGISGKTLETLTPDDLKTHFVGKTHEEMIKEYFARFPEVGELFDAKNIPVPY